MNLLNCLLFRTTKKLKRMAKEKKRERNWGKIPKYKCVFSFRRTEQVLQKLNHNEIQLHLKLEHLYCQI